MSERGLVSFFIYIIQSFFLLFSRLTAIPSKKKRKIVCLKLVCQKREFAARSSSCEVSR